MVRRRRDLELAVCVAATLFGVLVEFLGFWVQELVRGVTFPGEIDLLLTLALFLLAPFLTTGWIVYRYTGELIKAVFFAALVIPLTLAILR
ncbi:MAG: hypothetical protein HY555_03570 [Euryarchaeota archaeon]|nr:hypothetical protein [Euryarchaeota archaeon]